MVNYGTITKLPSQWTSHVSHHRLQNSLKAYSGESEISVDVSWAEKMKRGQRNGEKILKKGRKYKEQWNLQDIKSV